MKRSSGDQTMWAKVVAGGTSRMTGFLADMAARRIPTQPTRVGPHLATNPTTRTIYRKRAGAGVDID
jgi:hypothetical protein